MCHERTLIVTVLGFAGFPRGWTHLRSCVDDTRTPVQQKHEKPVSPPAYLGVADTVVF